MFGLGVYLADLAQKSHRYVREPCHSGSDVCAPRRDFAWQTVLAGRWRDFDAEQQEEFEEAHSSGEEVHSFSARGWRYHLDFKRMVQINLSTSRERPVRRIKVNQPAEREESETSATTLEARDTIASRAAGGQPVYSMLRCRVCLGNPYLIEGNLMKGDAMHDMCWCQDPSDAVETAAEPWSVAKGHDAFYVRGLAGAQKAGLGVFNSEYIVFQPYQILPLYQVDYVLE